MNSPYPATIIPNLAINIVHDDVMAQLCRIPGGEGLVGQIEDLELGDLGSSATVFRLLKIDTVSRSKVTLSHPETGQQTSLTLGRAAGFLTQASVVVAGAYTIGGELQNAAARGSARRDYLQAYLLEQAGLALLGKTGESVSQMIEELARERGWGVGPLLSPGSVHGWELIDQANLCHILPLSEIGMNCDEIGMNCDENGVLTPFNSLTFLVGLGPGYTSKRIGSPCTVCNNRQNCHLRC